MKKGERTILVGFLLGLVTTIIMGTAWNGTYEAVPAGTDLASDLDTFITSLKAETRQRLEVEHQFGGSTDDNGLHALGSARCFVQTTAPTDIQAGTAALGPYTGTSDASTLLTTDTPGTSTDDIGLGRCWLDSDDNYALYTWNVTTNAWVPAGLDSSIPPGHRNLVYNGQFETTNGTGLTSATVVAGVGAGTPVGWSLSVTPDIAYGTSPNAQGDGLTMNVTGNGAANEGVSQTMKGLKGSTTYYAVARATPGASGDSCSIRTTGATTNVGASGSTHTIAAGTTAATIYGFFVTDATPTDVVLILESDVDGDICKFDYVGVYEAYTDLKGVPEPKVEVASVSSTTTQSITTSSPILQDGSGDMVRSVTVPRPGYSILVLADAAFGHDTNNCNSIVLQLKEEIDGGGFTAVRTTALAMSTGGTDFGGGSVHWVRSNPNAGSIYSYLLTADCVANTATSNEANAFGDAANDLDSLITVMLIPTG